MNRTLSGSLAPKQLLRRRYSIVEKIGEGSFGAVYKAKDTQLGNRLVALKEMVEDNPSQPAIDNFKQEAYMLAALHHPHLPSIHEHFKDAGYWYLVMDFIEGETLQDYLDKHKQEGKLPLKDVKDIKNVLDIGIQLCTVLDYLHMRQPPIIFLDLKPLNIMKTSEGHLYLIDFGIARHFKPGQAKDTLILGSPGYAAPEQYGKAQTTPRADIYSLGATLHQLITGDDPSQKPFQFAPLSILAIPAELGTLIMQMVEIDADKRPASAKDVKGKLQLTVTQLSQYISPPQPPIKPAVMAPAPVGPPNPGIQPPLQVQLPPKNQPALINPPSPQVQPKPNNPKVQLVAGQPVPNNPLSPNIQPGQQILLPPQQRSNPNIPPKPINPNPPAPFLKRRKLLIGLTAAGLALAATQEHWLQSLINQLLSTSTPTLRPDRISTPQKTTTPEVPVGRRHMAKQEHIDILIRGVETWNRWRSENPGIAPSLSGVDLRRKNLSGADLREADLSGARLVEVNLARGTLAGADLRGAYMSESNLAEADLREAKLTQATLSRVNLEGADLGGAELTGTKLSQVNLRGAILPKGFKAR
jgi:serine/threonine protein kinase